MNKTTKFSMLMIGLALTMITGCRKKDTIPPSAPSVTTAALTNITTTSATGGGTITGDGGSAITASGIVLSKYHTTPTLTDTVMTATATTGSFTVNLTNLDFSTTYYIRAFATNTVGTGYGDVVTLNTTNDTTKVRFIYNGQTVTYGIIISSTTGKKWLDRNLGASQAAASLTDASAYGDYYQWGRLADGHQIKTSDTTGAVSSADVPGHNKLIIHSSTADWRDPHNNNLWQGVAGVNNPCPSGWRLPTATEFTNEVGITDPNSAFTQIKLTLSGSRDGGGAMLVNQGSNGAYWTSTVSASFLPQSAKLLSVGSGSASIANQARQNALTVRCIKD